MIPPYLIYFSFGKTNFGIWFPLFIFWPLGIALFLILLPFWIIAALFLIWIPEYRRVLKIPAYIHSVICSISGLIIDVNDENTNFSIKII